MKSTISALSTLCITVLFSISASDAYATNSIAKTKLSVKTSVVEVNGVREIEAGDYKAGIRKSKASLRKSSAASIRKPLLDNLCAAHIAIDDIQQATQYCNAAVSTGRPSSISYNNRAVMHYIAGNVQASIDDLETAQDLGMFNTVVSNNMLTISQHSMLSKN
ncbi:MAG: hypothetical protein WA981_17135 [Glaciecola sp.]